MLFSWLEKTNNIYINIVVQTLDFPSLTDAHAKTQMRAHLYAGEGCYLPLEKAGIGCLLFLARLQMS